MRIAVTDEAIACFKDCSTRNVISLRNILDNQVPLAHRNYSRSSDIWIKPWSIEYYPPPNQTATGKITKKINMNIVSKILFDSRLVFRLKAKEDSFERRNFKHANGKGYRGLHVRHIFQKFAEHNREKRSKVDRYGDCFLQKSSSKISKGGVTVRCNV